MKKLQAYNNDPEFRSAFIAEMEWHEQQDRVLQGTYEQGTCETFKGCAIGCAAHSLSKVTGNRLAAGGHIAVAKYLGIPAGIAYLVDGIFENLPRTIALKFPLRVSNAIQLGADYSMVIQQFIFWILQDAPKPANEPKELTEYYEELMELHLRWAETGTRPSLASLARTQALAVRAADKLIELLEAA